METWDRGTEQCGVRSTHPPLVPQGPCLALLVLRQKAGFVHRNLQGQRYYPPPYLTPALLTGSPAAGLADAVTLSPCFLSRPSPHIYLLLLKEKQAQRSVTEGLPLRWGAQVSPLDLLPLQCQEGSGE